MLQSTRGRIFWRLADWILRCFSNPPTYIGIVMSQILRFLRICTREADRVEAVRILVKALRGRGYSRRFLRSAIKEERKVAGGKSRLQVRGFFLSLWSFPKLIRIWRQV